MSSGRLYGGLLGLTESLMIGFLVITCVCVAECPCPSLGVVLIEILRRPVTVGDECVIQCHPDYAQYTDLVTAGCRERPWSVNGEHVQSGQQGYFTQFTECTTTIRFSAKGVHDGVEINCAIVFQLRDDSFECTSPPVTVDLEDGEDDRSSSSDEEDDSSRTETEREHVTTKPPVETTMADVDSPREQETITTAGTVDRFDGSASGESSDGENGGSSDTENDGIAHQVVIGIIVVAVIMVAVMCFGCLVGALYYKYKKTTGGQNIELAALNNTESFGGQVTNGTSSILGENVEGQAEEVTSDGVELKDEDNNGASSILGENVEGQAEEVTSDGVEMKDELTNGASSILEENVERQAEEVTSDGVEMKDEVTNGTSSILEENVEGPADEVTSYGVEMKDDEKIVVGDASTENKFAIPMKAADLAESKLVSKKMNGGIRQSSKYDCHRLTHVEMNSNTTSLGGQNGSSNETEMRCDVTPEAMPLPFPGAICLPLDDLETSTCSCVYHMGQEDGDIKTFNTTTQLCSVDMLNA